MNGVGCQSVKGPTAANDILDHAARLVDLSTTVFNGMESKLHGVAFPEYPNEPCATKGETRRTLPPLFHELQQTLDVIERNLRAMRDYMDRVDL